MNTFKIEELLQKPIITMKGDEFIFLLSNLSLLTKAEVKPVESKPKNLVHGIPGIASIFGCSIPTANRIKKSGIIDDAISQHNRTIVVDVDKALQLVAESKKEKKGNAKA